MKVKRILSSIMATVMVATSLVTVNVSSVWAAPPTVSYEEGTNTALTAVSKADAGTYLYTYTPNEAGTALQVSPSPEGVSVTLSLKSGAGAVNIGTTTVNNAPKVGAADNIIKGLKTGQTVVMDFLWDDNSAGTVTFNMNGSAKNITDKNATINCRAKGSSTRPSYQATIKVDEDGDLYFYNGKAINISAIGVKAAETSGTEEGETTPTITEEPDTTAPFIIDKISKTNVEGECIVIGRFQGSDPNDYEKVGISLGKTKENCSKLITSDTLYNEVNLDGQTHFAINSIFAVLVTGVPTTTGTLVCAKGYSKKNDGSVIYSTAHSAKINDPVETPATPENTVQ